MVYKLGLRTLRLCLANLNSKDICNYYNIINNSKKRSFNNNNYMQNRNNTYNANNYNDCLFPQQQLTINISDENLKLLNNLLEKTVKYGLSNSNTNINNIQ